MNKNVTTFNLKLVQNIKMCCKNVKKEKTLISKMTKARTDKSATI